MKIEELKPEIGVTFIDLDGVVAWLDKATANYNNITLQQQLDAGWDSKYWQNVKKTANIEEFYANLEWEPNGKKLVQWFLDRNLPIAFLSRPTREPTTSACIAGKKKWLKRMGLIDIPVIFEFDKEKYARDEAGRPNLLIDDHSGNVQKFIDAGGLAIHYRDFWFPQVIEKLETIFNS